MKLGDCNKPFDPDIFNNAVVASIIIMRQEIRENASAN